MMPLILKLPLCSLSRSDLLLQRALCPSRGEGDVSLAELLALSGREVSFAEPLSAEAVAGRCGGSVQPKPPAESGSAGRCHSKPRRVLGSLGGFF